MSSIKALVSVTITYLGVAPDLAPLEEWLPSKTYQRAVAGILRQAVERLDNVRVVAVEGLIALLQSPPASMEGPEMWRVRGEPLARLELIDT